MYLLELMWVLGILLLLGFSVKLHSDLVDTVKLKHEVIMYHSYIATNRLYNKYGSQYFALGNKHNVIFYRIVTKENGGYYSPYHKGEAQGLQANFYLSTADYRGFNRTDLYENYATGSFRLYYRGLMASTSTLDFKA